MKTIYRTPESKAAVLALYDAQMKKLGLPFHDLSVETSFGATHLVEIGNPEGKPLLVFHGGNSTTAYNLLACRFLLDTFHVYAADIVGHPGRSAETSLSPGGEAYGEWAGEVIGGLGMKSMRCFGGSFGAGVLAKLMCACPEKVSRAVLCVPSGIHNALPLSSVKMLLPLLRYRRKGDAEDVRRAAMCMSVTADALDEDTLDTVRMSFEHVKTKMGMPGNVSAKRMARCKAPTLVMAGEKDILFPAGKVLPRARRIIPDCRTYLLEGRGHIHQLTDGEQAMIVDFLNQ